MNFAYIVFDNFGVTEYQELMNQIIFFHDDQHVCESYNYRLLFREFWIKSPPQLKKEIIRSESEDHFGTNLIDMLFELMNFTADDLANINLILEYANSDERENILLNQGHNIFEIIIFSHDIFDKADLFLKNLDLNQDTLQTFKEDFKSDSIFENLEMRNINLVEKIFKWVAGSDDIDEFKEEIFQRWTRSNRTEYLFCDLEEETSFSFLNKIIKWFLKTDEKIEEWKKNIEYSPLVDYLNSQWFDRLLKYQGHSHEEALVIKREILFGNLPDIAKLFLNYINERVTIDRNVFCLCSYEKEKILEFTDRLRSFYEDSIKQKICLLCLNNDHVLGDGEEAQLFCQNHGTNGFVTHNKVDSICSSLLKEFDFSLRIQKYI